MFVLGAPDQETREMTPADILEYANGHLAYMVNHLNSGKSLSKKQTGAMLRTIRLISHINTRLPKQEKEVA